MNITRRQAVHGTFKMTSWQLQWVSSKRPQLAFGKRCRILRAKWWTVKQMRYVLYVLSKQDADRLLKNTTFSKSNTVVNLLTKVVLPEWMQTLPAPMIADTAEDVLYYGDDAIAFLKSKQKALDDID